MELDELAIEIKPGICRCCLSRNSSRDIAVEYLWQGETELYTDMLQFTFNVTISSHSNGELNGCNSICETCILRLRDATMFKKQVIQCEKQFLDNLNGASVADGTQLKLEPIKQDSQDDGDDGAWDDSHCADDEEDDQPLQRFAKIESKKDNSQAEDDAIVKEKLKVRKRKSTMSSDRLKRVKVRRKKTNSGSNVATKISGSDDSDTIDKKRVNANMEFEDSAESGVKLKRPDRRLDSATGYNNRRIGERHTAIYKRKNAETVLENTTCKPFRIFRNAIGCLSCRTKYEDPAEFRKHMDTKHPKYDISSVCKKYKPIRVDTFGLQCKLCSTPLDSINSVVEHLKAVHKKPMLISECGIIPFYLDSPTNYTCVICKDKYVSFRQLNDHMDFHFQRYVCDFCGRGFVNIRAYYSHKFIEHSPSYICKTCDKSFASYKELAKHYVTHLVYICMVAGCSEKFDKRYSLLKHATEFHGQYFKCELCDAQFKHRARRNEHMNLAHARERTHVCSICGKSFAQLHLLKVHVISHTDARDFTCALCSNSYKYKKGLERHMRKKHKKTQ